MRMHDNPTINYPDYVWPEGKRCAVVFSLDLDAESPFLWISRGQTVQHLGEIEQRRYGPRQGLARVTQLFEEYGIRGSLRARRGRPNLPRPAAVPARAPA